MGGYKPGGGDIFYMENAINSLYSGRKYKEALDLCVDQLRIEENNLKHVKINIFASYRIRRHIKRLRDILEEIKDKVHSSKLVEITREHLEEIKHAGKKEGLEGKVILLLITLTLLLLVPSFTGYSTLELNKSYNNLLGIFVSILFGLITYFYLCKK